MRIRVLISPLAKAAYFDSYRDVAKTELAACGFEGSDSLSIGGFDFLELDVDEPDLPALARLSVTQGLFEVHGDALEPLPADPDFCHSEALIYGQKYQGKTNELVTQFGINVGLKNLSTRTSRVSLLDPMAGRGTTILWALRYDMNALGIEVDLKATELFYAHVKKQCKLTRLKHRALRGQLGKEKNQGEFCRFTIGEQQLTMVHGDSQHPVWRQGKRFDLIVTDLPYGIQHTGASRRSPMSAVYDCAPEWRNSLKPGGAMVLIFNNYQTKRAELIAAFASLGLDPQEFTVRHRMSESIIRDLVVFRSPEM